MSSRLWGLLEVPEKVEFISYSDHYREKTLSVIRNSFFKYEIGCVTCEIDSNLEAKKDLEKLCEEVLRSSGVSIIARDVNNDEIVGVAINMIQVKPKDCNELTYFQNFRDNVCRTENSKSMLNFMINMESKFDFFGHYEKTSLMEIMFLAVLPEYGHKGIGLNLCGFSIELAKELSSGLNLVNFPIEVQSHPPQLISAIWSYKNSQKIGKKLDFECLLEDSHHNYIFKGKTMAHFSDPSAVTVLAAKRLSI